MKKILVTLFSICMLTIATNAQTASVSKDSKAAEKEAKAKQKQLQQENIDKALKEIGATAKEITEFKDALEFYGSQSNTVRKDEALTAEQKEEKLKEIQEEKNGKLKNLVGEARYKQYNKIRKEQKIAEDAIVAPFKQ